MDFLLQDLRHALRALRHHRMLTIVAVATLALGVGATTTLFSVVDAVMLRPLPFPDPARIVSVSEVARGVDMSVAAGDNIIRWRAARALATVAAYTSSSAALTGAGEPIQLRGTRVTPEFFSLLGVRSQLGRTFVPEDGFEGAPPVVLLSRALWRDRFGGDPGILGRRVMLDGEASTVIGVLNDAVELPGGGTYWRPLRLEHPADGSIFFYSVIARVRSGFTVVSARNELNSITSSLNAARPASQRGNGVVVMTLHDRMFGSVRGALMMLFGAVLFLLLIACANVANLLLARGTSRRREIAVRRALGAGRWRLARQVVTESVLISLAGAGVGMLIPAWAVGAFVRLSPDSIARLAGAHVDARVLAFAVAVALLTGLMFGAIPAWLGTRDDALDSLHDGAVRSTAPARQQHVRSALVIAELATALALLTGAGLLTRSFINVLAVDPGYRPDHLVAATIYLPDDRYAAPAARRAFFETLVERLRVLPGVQSVALTDGLPSSGFRMSTTLSALSGRPDSTPVAISRVSREYPRTVGLIPVAGRLFEASDGSPPAALLSVSAARALFPDGHAVGQLLPASHATRRAGPTVVVGVVQNVPQLGVDVTPIPHAYFMEDAGDQSIVVLRFGPDGPPPEPMIRHAVAAVDSLQPVASLQRIDQTLSRALAPRRLNFLVLDVFAGLALLLAAIGLYGVMAFQVALRTREIGIRIALGATGHAVRGLILRQGMTMVVAGCVLGLAFSVMLSRVLAGFLFGVGARDAAAFVTAPLVLCGVAALACYFPARRATTVDPVIALRDE